MKVDVEQASRVELLDLIKQLLAGVQLLEVRVHELEAENEHLRAGGTKEPPSWVKASRSTSGEKKERQKRARGSGRHRHAPTKVMQHAVAECPQCDLLLGGGREVSRRQVSDVPRVPVEVTDHVVVERLCPHCRTAWKPAVDLREAVVGGQRIGIHLQTEVAVLRERWRLPFRSIQDDRLMRCGLEVRVGELVSLVHGVAARGRSVYASLARKSTPRQ